MTAVSPIFQNLADAIALKAVVDGTGVITPEDAEMQCRAYIRAFGRTLKDLRGPEVASAELYACADQIATGGRP